VSEQNFVTHGVCLSVVLVFLMKYLEMNFVTRGASQEDEGVGCNKCHIFSRKEDTACAM